MAEEVALVVEYIVDTGYDVGQVNNIIDMGKDVVATAGDGEVAIEKVCVEVDNGAAVIVVEVFEFASPQVVDNIYFVSFFYESFGQIRAYHAASAGDEYSFHITSYLAEYVYI